MTKIRFEVRTRRALLAAAGIAAALVATPAQAQKINFLLDWAWIPYHTIFLTAEDRGFYREAGLEVKIEQGRGSATTAIVVGQGNFDIGHINSTNVAQAIGKGVPLKSIAVYQHRSSASFAAMKEKHTLKGAESLKGLKIGSTPGGSDALSLAIFKKINNIPEGAFTVVGLDGAAKRAAVLTGAVDAVSGDSHAFAAILRGAGKEPSMFLLSDYGVPLLGFGFAANEEFIKKEPQAIKRFLAATKRGFQAAIKDPKASCEFMKTKVLLTGTVEFCVDYYMGLMELSQSPDDPNWGRQTPEEWSKLVAALKSVDEIKSDKKSDDYFTNEFVP